MSRVKWWQGEQPGGDPWWPSWAVAIGVEKMGHTQRVLSTEGGA